MSSIVSEGKTSGAVALWVDDYFVVGEVEFTKYIQEKISAEFTVGKVVRDEFKYLGIQTKLAENGTYTQSQLDYIEGLEKVEVPVGDDKKDLDEYGLAVLRQGTGKLNWVAQGTRPELCFRVAELSTTFKK